MIFATKGLKCIDTLEICFPLIMPDNLSPGDENTYNWAKLVLHECISSHGDCRKPILGRLPTRVIQLINEDDLRLVSGADQGHYVALSYCWGGPQFFSTTEQNLPAMETGFRISSLPQTIQDAVTVTRKLGFQYLWVDSICIIQDSEEDQLHELPKMASYYEKAYFTLIAGGSSCTQGFLHPRKACEKHSGASDFRNMLARPFLCAKGHEHVLLFREETPYESSKEPVSKRAWTFQERILSPRVLMYGQRVTWQCQSFQASDGGCDDWIEDPWSRGQRGIYTELNKDRVLDASEGVLGDLYPLKGRSADKLYDLWYQIVREYSRRSLTFQDDKFPAISALATKMQGKIGGKYLAGLWSKDLLRGLLWSTYPTVTLVKPQTWRAPSWSWASVNNPIIYRRLPGPSAVVLAEVLECTITPKHLAAPHGEIKDAALEISGMIMTPPSGDFTKQIMKQDNRITHDNMGKVMMELALFNEESSNAGFVNWEPPEKHVLLLLYASMRDGSDWEDEKGVATVAGLVLREVEENKYERVGCFTTMGLQGVKYLTQQLPKKTMHLI